MSLYGEYEKVSLASVFHLLLGKYDTPHDGYK